MQSIKPNLKRNQLKKVTYKMVLVIGFSSLIACGGGSEKQPAIADGFSDIENDIKNEFGSDAYYTDLTITYKKSIGNIIGVTVTEDLSTLKIILAINTLITY
ncbi:hypothetical protein [uncultured Winogradskyella sp.]|uniref:hypothetical protein n=1 Tax=uncultured Winogradskyella sp. TaxID=395353 RepID=UPI00262ABBD1|nr:hypothetical protein [uncultured Winogradskyella sp.]